MLCNSPFVKDSFMHKSKSKTKCGNLLNLLNVAKQRCFSCGQPECLVIAVPVPHDKDDWRNVVGKNGRMHFGDIAA